MAGRGKQPRGGGKGNAKNTGKSKGKSSAEEVVAAAVDEATEQNPGNHGNVSSEEDDPGTHGEDLLGHGSPVTRSGRTCKPLTPSRQDTRTTTTSGNSVASTSHVAARTSHTAAAPRYTRPHNYRSKCPKFTGEKHKWPRFSDEFWLFLRELNQDWDIHESTFTEDEDIDIYNYLSRAMLDSLCYAMICPKYRNKGQAAFKHLEQYCLGSSQSRINRNWVALQTLRLGENEPVAPYASRLFRLEDEFVTAGVLAHPSRDEASWLVALQMCCMPGRYNNLMDRIRLREDIPMPSLAEFIRLLIAEEEALNLRTFCKVKTKSKQ